MASLADQANAGHPDQWSFLAGAPEKFAGHEPDAATPSGNPDRWIRQVGDGVETAFWYHPNAWGHTVYAELLLAQGTFGAG